MEASAALVDRVFASVLAPLVTGGVVRPTRPIGARAALALLRVEPRPSDADLASRVDLARCAAARRLVPVDLAPDPDGATFALGAALHDLLQVAHPGWARRASAKRLLDLVVQTLDRVPPPASAREALGRHTWLSRLLSLQRTDRSVSWWTGSRELYGEEPPARLVAWPAWRRVRVEPHVRSIPDLVAHGGVVELMERWRAALGLLLQASPLTDLANCAREEPPFQWSRASLALAGSPVTRTLASRATALAGDEDAVRAALDRATLALPESSRGDEARLAARSLSARGQAPS